MKRRKRVAAKVAATRLITPTGVAPVKIVTPFLTLKAQIHGIKGIVSNPQEVNFLEDDFEVCYVIVFHSVDNAQSNSL